MKVTDFSDFSYYEKICILTKEDLLSAIPRIEKLIRSSKEYKCFISCARETDDIKGCSFFIDKNLDDCTLEIHHIISLYTLCQIAGEKLLKDLKSDEYILALDIVKEVLNMHFKDLVPVISLTKTVHELYHSNQYQLPKTSKQLHLGEYKEFIKEYKDYLDMEAIKNTYEYFDEIKKEEFEKYLEEIQR